MRSHRKRHSESPLLDSPWRVEPPIAIQRQSSPLSSQSSFHGAEAEQPEDKHTAQKNGLAGANPKLQLKRAQSHGFNFGNISVYPSSYARTFPVQSSTHLASPIQTKLMVGASDDHYEQEADHVAQEVVRHIHAPQSVQASRDATLAQKGVGLSERRPDRSLPNHRSSLTTFQRSMIQRLIRDPVVAGEGAVSAPFETSLNQQRSSGHALPSTLQRKMGKAMGADFSGVKVHTNTQSDQLSQTIQAKAFTTGQDIFFKQGEYRPNSQSGQELIAHELTHVVQQKGDAVQRQPMVPTTQANASEHSSATDQASDSQQLNHTFPKEPIISQGGRQTPTISRQPDTIIQRSVGLEIEVPVPVDDLSTQEVQDIQEHVQYTNLLVERSRWQHQQNQQQPNPQGNTSDTDVQGADVQGADVQGADVQGTENGGQGASQAPDIPDTLFQKFKAQEELAQENPMTHITRVKAELTNRKVPYGRTIRDSEDGFSATVDHDSRVLSTGVPLDLGHAKIGGRGWPPVEGGHDSLMEIVTEPLNTEDEIKTTFTKIAAYVNTVKTNTGNFTHRWTGAGGEIQGIGPLTHGLPYTARPEHNFEGSIQVNIGIDLREYASLAKWYANSTYAKPGRRGNNPDFIPEEQEAHQKYKDIAANIKKAVTKGKAVTTDLLDGDRKGMMGRSGGMSDADKARHGNLRGIRGWLTHMALYLLGGQAGVPSSTIKNITPILMKTPNEIAIQYGMTQAEQTYFQTNKQDLLNRLLRKLGLNDLIGKNLKSTSFIKGYKSPSQTFDNGDESNRASAHLGGLIFTGQDDNREDSLAIQELPDPRYPQAPVQRTGNGDDDDIIEPSQSGTATALGQHGRQGSMSDVGGTHSRQPSITAFDGDGNGRLSLASHVTTSDLHNAVDDVTNGLDLPFGDEDVLASDDVGALFHRPPSGSLSEMGALARQHTPDEETVGPGLNRQRTPDATEDNFAPDYHILLIEKMIESSGAIGPQRKGNDAVKNIPDIDGKRAGVVVEFRNLPGLYKGPESWKQVALDFLREADSRNKRGGLTHDANPN